MTVKKYKSATFLFHQTTATRYGLAFGLFRGHVLDLFII